MHSKTSKAEPGQETPSAHSQRVRAPRAKLSKYLALGSIAVLAPSAAILLLAEAERKRLRNHQIIRLMKRINQVREEEQRHIARELHDNIGQRLSLLSIRLGSLLDDGMKDDGMKSLDSAETAELVREVDDLVSEVHNLSHNLHPSKLEYLGLVDALAEMCHEISCQHNIDIRFQLNGTYGRTRPEISLCFYRVAQEALNNVIKHSGAARVQVTLTGTDDRLLMQISDDGVGFNPRSRTYGLGLVSMEERILSVNGTLSISSRLREGTSVIAEAPLNQNRFETIPALDESNSQASQLTIL